MLCPRRYGAELAGCLLYTSNQRMLINRFLDNHPELSHCQRSEFADDGYTGMNFHRPQFTQMMEKVKRGEIDLDVYKRQVKD